MNTKTFIKKVNAAKDNLELVEVFDQVESEATADTAVTEYRGILFGILLKKLEELK